MRRKIVTLCGSMRFFEQMQRIAEQLELEKGWAVLNVVPHVLDRGLTEEEKHLLGEIHRTRIELSDAVFIVNPGGYTGPAVRAEIEYARSLNKEIIYLESESEQEVIS